MRRPATRDLPFLVVTILVAGALLYVSTVSLSRTPGWTTAPATGTPTPPPAR